MVSHTKPFPGNIEEFLNPKSMLTPGIAGSLTMTITNALGVQFALPLAWTALSISALFGMLVFRKDILPLWQKLIFYVLNTLVIFSVAVGANTMGVMATKASPTRHLKLIPNDRVSFIELAYADQKALQDQTESLIRQKEALRGLADSLEIKGQMTVADLENYYANVLSVVQNIIVLIDDLRQKLAIERDRLDQSGEELVDKALRLGDADYKKIAEEYYMLAKALDRKIVQIEHIKMEYLETLSRFIKSKNQMLELITLNEFSKARNQLIKITKKFGSILEIRKEAGLIDEKSFFRPWFVPF